jgi:hypothetical protein
VPVAAILDANDRRSKHSDRADLTHLSAIAWPEVTRKACELAVCSKYRRPNTEPEATLICRRKWRGGMILRWVAVGAGATFGHND